MAVQAMTFEPLWHWSRELHSQCTDTSSYKLDLVRVPSFRSDNNITFHVILLLHACMLLKFARKVKLLNVQVISRPNDKNLYFLSIFNAFVIGVMWIARLRLKGILD